jgi:hypothetical protein
MRRAFNNNKEPVLRRRGCGDTVRAPKIVRIADLHALNYTKFITLTSESNDAESEMDFMPNFSHNN